MKRKLTEQQQVAAADRRAAFRKLAGNVSRMSAEQRAEFAARIPAIVTIEGRPLSIFNQCLIASQSPSATIVGGFRQWIKAGRCVRKGEHGLALWVPSVRKAESSDDADGEAGDAETRFIMGTVFDVSQTDELVREEAPIDQEVNYFQSQDLAIANQQRERSERTAV